MWLREQIPEIWSTADEYHLQKCSLPFNGRKLAEILKEHGYDTHPQGMAQPIGVDYRAKQTTAKPLTST